MAVIGNVPKLAAEGRYPVSVGTVSGTWEAEIKTRTNGVIDTGTHEVLTLSTEASETFSYNGHFAFTCVGKWWLTLAPQTKGGLAEIHINGVNASTGGRCPRDILVRKLAGKSMIGEYVGEWRWPDPVGRLIVYHRIEVRP